MKTVQQLNQIRNDIEMALEAITKKHGLEKVNIGRFSHHNDGFRTTLEVQYQGGDTLDMKALKLNAPFLGFTADIAGATIQYGGKEGKIVGMKRTNLLIEIKGKTYTAKIDDVKRVLQSQKSEYVA